LLFCVSVNLRFSKSSSKPVFTEHLPRPGAASVLAPRDDYVTVPALGAGGPRRWGEMTLLSHASVLAALTSIKGVGRVWDAVWPNVKLNREEFGICIL
jgi:hypothetical protein